MDLLLTIYPIYQLNLTTDPKYDSTARGMVRLYTYNDSDNECITVYRITHIQMPSGIKAQLYVMIYFQTILFGVCVYIIPLRCYSTPYKEMSKVIKSRHSSQNGAIKASVGFIIEMII